MQNRLFSNSAYVLKLKEALSTLIGLHSSVHIEIYKGYKTGIYKEWECFEYHQCSILHCKVIEIH